MIFKFETKNINKRAYRRIVNRWIQENFGKSMMRKLRYANIIFRSSERIGEEPFFDSGSNGTGGVTDPSGIRVYVFDFDGVDIRHGSNILTVSHELAHLCLLHSIIGSKRVKLRNDDFGGNKAGKIMNYSTAEVHDRQAEGRNYISENWLWTGKMWRRVSYMTMDFRDHKL